MTPIDTAEGPVTVIVSRRIKPGREADFEAWLMGITQEAHNFPGYMGTNVIKPSSDTHPKFVTIFRFDSYSNLLHWEESDVRHRWLQLADEMAESESKIQRLPGLEFWFTPDRATPTPPRYKMAIILTLVIFGLTQGVSPLLRALFESWPPLLGQFMTVVIQVALMTYVILPYLTKLLSRWLFATRSPRRIDRSQQI